MFNFAGKYSANEKKAPSEVDLSTFWKTLDETWFPLIYPNSLENAHKEVIADSRQKFVNGNKIIYFHH